MQASAGPPEISNHGDQDEQVWRDVKAETGFSSYKEYVTTLVDWRQRYSSLRERLLWPEGPEGPSDWGEIFVLDIQKDGSKVISLNAAYSQINSPRPSHGSRLETSLKINTRLLQILRSPPEDIPVRIVLWSMHRESRPPASIINALGLGLDIDPSFFENLLHLLKTSHSLFVTRSHQIIIGDNIATVARDYRRERDAPPILIIAGYFDLRSRSRFYLSGRHNSYFDILKRVIDQEISGRTSFFRSAIDRAPADDLASMSSNEYLTLLSRYVYKGCYIDSDFNFILLIAVLPLLHLEILRLRGQCCMIDSALTEANSTVEFPEAYGEGHEEANHTRLDRQRFWLRRRVEGLQESRDTFRRFARSQNAANWLKTEKWVNQDADIEEALTMARAKELEVRDYMQLQIGKLSISESRRSIQLSNRQMTEAKRGKKSN